MRVTNANELSAKLLDQIELIEKDTDGKNIRKAMAICAVAGRVVQVEKFNRETIGTHAPKKAFPSR